MIPRILKIQEWGKYGTEVLNPIGLAKSVQRHRKNKEIVKKSWGGVGVLLPKLRRRSCSADGDKPRGGGGSGGVFLHAKASL